MMIGIISRRIKISDKQNVCLGSGMDSRASERAGSHTAKNEEVESEEIELRTKR
jgi:hypothetical protein